MKEMRIEVDYYKVKEVKVCCSCKSDVKVNEEAIDIGVGENRTFMCDDCLDILIRKIFTEMTGVNHMY